MTTASTAGAPIVAQGVTKDYGEGAGIHELDLVVAPGTILGIVGPSGAGKTTTIRILTGAVDPDKGDVRVLGEDPRRFRRATRERVGYMPQLFTLYPDLTAEENVDFVASLFGMLWRRRRRRVREVLQFTQLIDAKDRRASKLSGGMQRRLELACALVHEPDLLFLDEPTAGIDPILRQSVWEELHRLKGAGRTLLVTTQYVTEAEECDQVALIAEGRLIALAPPGELRREAMGGDLLEVETKAPFDPDVLTGRPHILRVETRGLRSFWAAVDDGPQMLPVIDDLVAEAGGEVLAAREIQPSFDEVFAALVRRERGSTQADAAGAAADAAAARREAA
jgi:ABC-2 type transport system ATP-binding protein